MQRRAARGYTAAERKRRVDTVTAWIEQHGLVCPGYRKPPHPVASRRELDADHVVPVSVGGEHGPSASAARACRPSETTAAPTTHDPSMGTPSPKQLRDRR